MLVTHQTQWLQAADRVLVLRGGAIAADGHWKALQLSGDALPELSHVATELTLADLDDSQSAEQDTIDSGAGLLVTPEATVAFSSIGGGSIVGGGSPTGGSGSAVLRLGAAQASGHADAVTTPRLGMLSPRNIVDLTASIEPVDPTPSLEPTEPVVDAGATDADDAPAMALKPADAVADPVAADAGTAPAAALEARELVADSGASATGDAPAAAAGGVIITQRVASHPVPLDDSEEFDDPAGAEEGSGSEEEEGSEDGAPTVALGPVGHKLPSQMAAVERAEGDSSGSSSSSSSSVDGTGVGSRLHDFCLYVTMSRHCCETASCDGRLGQFCCFVPAFWTSAWCLRLAESAFVLDASYHVVSVHMDVWARGLTVWQSVFTTMPPATAFLPSMP